MDSETWAIAGCVALLGGAWWFMRSAATLFGRRSAATLPAPGGALHVDPLEMVALPGGKFWMGSAKTDAHAEADEMPRQKVEVRPFTIGKYAATQKLYREVTGRDPAYSKGDEVPANNVTWYQAIEFCNLLSQRNGLQPVYSVEAEAVTWNEDANGYRLPTEAEWEYACRAGTETLYSFGDDERSLGEFAWFDQDDPEPVGRKKANPWGLHDMHGNVWEWCWDWHRPYPCKPPARTLPNGGDRVARGGSYDKPARFLRSAVRNSFVPDAHNGLVGFRCARSVASRVR
jgi:formylglycine-generating enzyme required for sulfatase activity